MLSYNRTKGFALTELIMVMVIMGIILAIAALNFNSWQRKAQIERQTRELLTDLNTARSESIFRKKMHSVVINADSMGYVLRRYSSLNEDRVAGGTPIATKSTFGYVITQADGTSCAGCISQFDIMGYTVTPADNYTWMLNPSGSGAAFDCVVISASRSNIGQMSGGSCVQK